MVPRGKEIAQSKINDFDIPSLTDQNILYLQISVHDTVPMAVIQSTCDLSTELPGLLFFQSAMRDDVVQHLTSINILEKHIPVIICSNNVPHGTYIWMTQ